jgi:hypothetical protein
MKIPALLSMLAISAAAAGCATTAAPAGGAAPAAAKKAPAEPQYRAADLEKMSAADLDRALGAPALTRIEGSGEFRRYMFDQCALMVILYPDEKGERRVARLDAGALVSGAAAPDLDACLAAGKAG